MAHVCGVAGATPCRHVGLPAHFPQNFPLSWLRRVEDKTAAVAGPAGAKVNFYTALGCPFCPVVEQRLRALQVQMGFSVEKIDVTLKPGLLASKGIRAVPVVEVGDRRLVGHATSEQLSELIRQAGKAA